MKRLDSRILTFALIAVAVAASGCAKQKKNDPAPRENLTNSGEGQQANGQWKIAATPDLGTQLIISTTDRSFKMDRTQQISAKDAPVELCRYRVTATDLNIYRHQGTVYDMEYRVTSAELVPSALNAPSCKKFMDQKGAKVAQGQVRTGFPFTFDKDKTTGTPILINLSVSQSPVSFWLRTPIKEPHTTCADFSGGFASEQDITLSRTHVYAHHSCSAYAYVVRYASEQPVSYAAVGEWEQIENTPDRQLRVKRRFVGETLEVVQIELKPVTQEETITTTAVNLNSWGDLIEQTTTQKKGEQARTSTETRIRQSF